MAKASTTTISNAVVGDGQNTSQTSTVTTAASAPPTTAALVNGSLTIAIPAIAAGFTLVPPVGSIVTKTLKGIAGDTGIPLAPAGICSIPLVPGALANFVITANAAETIQIFWQ
jgi:hypothetical protein